MAHCNTIFSQILKFVSRHAFEALANRHHSGRAFRATSVRGVPGNRHSYRDHLKSMIVRRNYFAITNFLYMLATWLQATLSAAINLSQNGNTR